MKKMIGYKKEARTMVSPVSNKSEVDSISSDVDSEDEKDQRYWLGITNRLRKWLRMTLR